MCALSGHCILILHSKIDQFVVDLQKGLRNAGAVSLVVRDVQSALNQMGEFDFTAVLASSDNAAIKESVELPTMLYRLGEHDANDVLMRLTRRLCAS